MYDREAGGKAVYPQGYEHDLALISLDQPTTMVTEKPLRFGDGTDLAYNQPIRLYTPSRPLRGGRYLVHGATIGQAIINKLVSSLGKKQGKKERKGLEATVDQFSRSILWRAAGRFKSVQGCSGSPLIINHKTEFVVVGFQNWQWCTRLDDPPSDDDEELKAESESEALRKAIDLPNVYGAYFLPDHLKGCIIPSEAKFEKLE